MSIEFLREILIVGDNEIFLICLKENCFFRIFYLVKKIF